MSRRMPFHEYVLLPGVNLSSLKRMDESPYHYKYGIDHPDHSTSDVMVRGQLTHAKTLEPETVADTFVVWEGPQLPPVYVIWTGGPKRGSDWTAFKAKHTNIPILTPKEVAAIENNDGAKRGNAWKAFKAANESRTIVRPCDVTAADAIAAAVRAHPVAWEYVGGPGTFEETIQWVEPSTGIECKSRLDRVREHHPKYGRVLVDLKITGVTHPRKFAAHCARMHYPAQLDFYKTALEVTGRPVDKVVMIVVEASAPHDVTVYELDEESLYQGELEWRHWLEQVAKCRLSQDWHGRHPTEQTLSLPGWAFDDGDEDESPNYGLTIGEKA